MSGRIELWSIKEVASELGVSPPTLRSWDRRYGITSSARTAGGHRRYTNEDVARLRSVVEMARRDRISNVVGRLAQEA